jgi:hypothetical protein
MTGIPEMCTKDAKGVRENPSAKTSPQRNCASTPETGRSRTQEERRSPGFCVWLACANHTITPKVRVLKKILEVLRTYSTLFFHQEKSFHDH